jgi:hypothetical protein
LERFGIALPVARPTQGFGGGGDDAVRIEDILMSASKPRRRTSKPTSNANASQRAGVAKTAAKSRGAGNKTVAVKTPATRSSTKQASVLSLLQTPAGATITSMMQVTGWQAHSVRGFLAGVVRKKLKLNLVSEEDEKGRVYRIKDVRLRSGTKVDGTARLEA